MAKQDDYIRLTVRLPPRLMERLRATGGDASVNAKVIEAIEAYFPEVRPSAELAAEMNAEIARMQVNPDEPFARVRVRNIAQEFIEALTREDAEARQHRLYDKHPKLKDGPPPPPKLPE